MCSGNVHDSCRRVHSDKLERGLFNRHTGKVVIPARDVMRASTVGLKGDNIAIGKNAVNKLSLVAVFAGSF